MRFTIYLLVCLLLMVTPQPIIKAQQETLLVLVTGVDVNGQGFPLVMIDLQTGQATTLATFANRPLCPPAVFPDGEALLYEQLDSAGQPVVYRIEVTTGERNVISQPTEQRFTCPVVSPDGSSVVWLTENEGTTLMLANADGSNVVELVTHTNIFDVKWSPGGAALVYHVTDETSPFPTLYSLPTLGDAEPRKVWQPQNGLLHDYMWISNSLGLLVAYYTDTYLGIALLPTDCVIGPGDPCTIEPLVTFTGQASLNLLEAYSPMQQKTIISLVLNGEDHPQTDLWLVDLNGIAPPQQITFTPDIVETDAHWSLDSTTVYFLGSQIEAEHLLGQIYMTAIDGDPEPKLLFTSSVFSPSSFLWWYE